MQSPGEGAHLLKVTSGMQRYSSGFAFQQLEQLNQSFGTGFAKWTVLTAWASLWLLECLSVLHLVPKASLRTWFTTHPAAPLYPQSALHLTIPGHCRGTGLWAVPAIFLQVTLLVLCNSPPPIAVQIAI